MWTQRATSVPPVIPHAERVEMIKSLKVVSEVITHPPLVLDAAFMTKHGIQLVAHGFADSGDADAQEEFFRAAREVGVFREIPYSTETSTSRIMDAVCANKAAAQAAAATPVARAEANLTRLAQAAQAAQAARAAQAAQAAQAG
jgi:glycerol-3-phosphate cytidylyltransferase-like family protein